MARRRLPFVASALVALAATFAPAGPVAAQTGPVIDDPGPVDFPPSASDVPTQSGPSVKAGVNQYGEPEWLPLRNPANVGCVRTNCNFDGNPYHGTWAIDFLDPANQAGDPIYAAGAGQAFINETGSQCGGSGTAGNSVRVDHGNGKISLYAHLNTISIANAQWVDQNTQLGTMGTTGIVSPCPSHHLHYHVQVNGTRIDPGPLKACHGNTLVTYPNAFGVTSWDSIEPPWENGVHGQVHSDGTACAGGGGNAIDPPADFDGNGTTDISVFRSSNGVWFVRNGSTVSWGTNGDIPVPANYDGTGGDDIAVFRPSTGTWFIRNGSTVTWGTNGDIPVPADYDGNGTDDIAVFRPSTGTWFVRNGVTVTFGTNGDIPVPADYDGNGTDEIAVFRPSTGTWFIRNGATVTFGTNGDIPVPADYDGNGTTDIAVFRPASGTWFVRNGATVTWGTSGDIPVPGNYDGTGADDIAVFRPSSGTWFVRNGSTVTFGSNGDIPLPLPWANNHP